MPRKRKADDDKMISEAEKMKAHAIEMRAELEKNMAKTRELLSQTFGTEIPAIKQLRSREKHLREQLDDLMKKQSKPH